MTATLSADSAAVEANVLLAARRLYDAECALHAAHQTRVDNWIAAAADALHQTVLEHRCALASAKPRNNESGVAECESPRLPRRCTSGTRRVDLVRHRLEKRTLQ